MGLTFAWVRIKISALKNCEEFILVKCALREAVEVVDYILHSRNERLHMRSKIQKESLVF